MTNSKVFAKAWKLARKGSRKFGGSVKSYFAESLRTIYAANKIESTINAERYEALKGVSRPTRHEAIELAGYHAAKHLAFSMRMLSDEHAAQHAEMLVLIDTLKKSSDNAIIVNSYMRGISIL